MEKEQTIKNVPVKTEYEKAAINLLLTTNWLLERIKKILDREDITHQQYNILRILQESPSPLSTLQIRERMLDKMSDTSRIVERLIKKGLVHKKLNGYDKRLVDVTITDKGLEVLERLRENNQQWDSILYGLTIEEASTLNKLLKKLRENELL